MGRAWGVCIWVSVCVVAQVHCMCKCAPVLASGPERVHMLLFGGNRGHSMGSVTESWEIREGLVSWTLRHLFSLLPTSQPLSHWTINAPLPWGGVESWTGAGMQGFHLLFINTGSGNTPHCQPNPLSLHLVPWQRGGFAMTRYRVPDVPWMTGGGINVGAMQTDRTLTLVQLWMFTNEDRVTVQTHT